MSASIELFGPELLPAVARFSERYWNRPTTPQFMRWRYIDSRPFARTIVALNDGECIATVSALEKQYLVAGVPTRVLEVFDWHCLPEFRSAGAGLRVMRAMMRQPEPLLSIGGTPDVIATIPRMGWRKIGTARVFELPMGGRRLSLWLRDRVRIPDGVTRKPLQAIAAVWFKPRNRRAPPSGQLVPVSGVGAQIVGLYRQSTVYGFVQEPRPALVRWMTTCEASNGAYLTLCFAVEGNLCGWVLARVYQRGGEVEAALLDVFAPKPDVATYEWMVREASAALAGFEPWLIRARATCPLLRAALHRARFVEKSEGVPLHLWTTGQMSVPEPLHVTLNHTDEPLRPYPAPHETAAFLGRDEPSTE